MPTLNGPDNFNNQFTVAADGTISLTTTPFSAAGGTISPGPVIISNAASAPQPFPVTAQLNVVSEAGSFVLADTYGTASPGFVSRRARGTAAAPTAVQSGDSLLFLGAWGRGATGYFGTKGQLILSALENWTDTAQGTQFGFLTTSLGTATLANRMAIRQGVVIGNPAPDPGQGGLILNANAAATFPPISNFCGVRAIGADGQFTTVSSTAFGAAPTFGLHHAGGTAAAPATPPLGQFIGAWQSYSWNGSAYAVATSLSTLTAEAWSATSNGSLLVFSTVANGTTGAAERVRIDHNGNVGIGTATPQAKLEVNQNAANPALYTGAEVTRFAAADSTACIVGAYSFSGAASGSAPGVVLHKKRGTGAAPTATQLGDNVGFITWNNFDGTAEHQAATINVTAAENTTSTNAGGILNFNTAGIGQTSVTQRMVIDGNGNVGIGTTAPGARLHVGASATSGGQENLGSTVLLTAPNDGNAPLILQRSGVVNPQMMNFGVNQASHWSEIQSAQSNVGFTNLLLNQSGGNVGIGTAAPSQKLAVVTATTTSPVGILVSNGSVTQERALFGVEGNTSGASMGGSLPYALIINDADGHGLQLGTANAARVTIDGGGNVGIGTATPLVKLDVGGGVAARNAGMPNPSFYAGLSGNINYSGILLGSGTNGNSPTIAASPDGNGNLGSLLFYAGNSQRMTILSGGQVIINTGTQSGAFTVNGSCANITGAWTTISDASVKQEVQPYTRGLDAIVALKPVQFRYVAGTPFTEGDKPSHKLFGLIADDVKPHVPEIVGTVKTTIGKKENVELSTLEPGNLIYALINAVKELNDQGKEMVARIAALESATVH